MEIKENSKDNLPAYSFRYRARDKKGELSEGIIISVSEDAAAKELRSQDYVPLLIEKAALDRKVSSFLAGLKRVRLSEIVMFTKQLAVLQKASVPILLSLRTLREETLNRNFRRILDYVIKDIEGGLSLSQAFERHPSTFDTFYVSMVKTGEATGKLDDSLYRLSALLENEEKTRLQIRAATRYPLIVILAMALGFAVLVTVVVPRFALIYANSAAALPLPTRILLLVNSFIKHYWWLALLIIAGAAPVANQLLKSTRVRKLRDRIMLRIPVFGELFANIIMSRFCRATGILLKSGVTLFKILELVSSVVNNLALSGVIAGIKQGVAEGKGFSGPMKASGMFSPVVVQMVSIGEQSGNLDELMLFVSDYYDAQVDYTIKNLTSLIEPVLIFILGLAVLGMALAIFLPMWNMMSIFRH